MFPQSERRIRGRVGKAIRKDWNILRGKLTFSVGTERRRFWKDEYCDFFFFFFF